MALEVEYETFKEKLPELRAEHEGEYALVHGTEIVGIFPTYGDAIKAGYKKFGHNPFFVNRIGPLECIVFVPRVVTMEESSELQAMLDASRARLREETGDDLQGYVRKWLGLNDAKST